MTIFIKNKDTLLIDDFKFKCSIGKNGTSKNKKEADKKTPKGKYSLGNLYYRNDRVKKPKTLLKCLPIKKSMGWCHDIRSKKFYNKLIEIKKNLKHEKLYRKDSKYNFIIPISYNTKPIIIGKGSAIFLHLTKNYSPTAGCIALKEKDFLILIKLIKKKTKIIIK